PQEHSLAAGLADLLDTRSDIRNGCHGVLPGFDDHIADLDAALGRRALRIDLRHHHALGLGIYAVLLAQILIERREAEADEASALRCVLAARLLLCGFIFHQARDSDLERAILTFPHDFDVHGLSDGRLRDEARQA